MESYISIDYERIPERCSGSIKLNLYDKVGGFCIAQASLDEDHFNKVCNFTWVYQGRKIYTNTSDGTKTLLTFLFGRSFSRQVRRKDASKLDFTRSNLKFPELPPLLNIVEEKVKEETESEPNFFTLLGPQEEFWIILYDSEFYSLTQKYSWTFSCRKKNNNVYCYVTRTLHIKPKPITVNFARVVLGIQDPQTGKTYSDKTNYVASYINPPDFELLVLDLRRSNLLCTTRSIVSTRKKTLGNKKSTSFIGVYKYGNKWVARIVKKELKITIGVYDTDIEAARERDNYIKQNNAKMYYRLNFLEGEDQ